MTDKIVTFIDPTTGRDVRYQRYSARLPEFLKVYDPKQGYRVEIEMTDLLSLQKGRLVLLREAVIAGKTPAEVGLPSIDAEVNTFVCTAKLLDAKDRTVRSARASMRILGFKDFEALETAANQRLLAALGFGGELLDDDEDRDYEAFRQGMARRDVTESSSSRPHTGAADASRQADATPTPALDDDEPVTEGERRHIETLARRANVSTPQLRTRGDVKAAQRELSLLAQQRRSNGHSMDGASSD
jgi:hypothetical protein